MDEYKNYADVKIYYDGSHYIGIPKENYPHGKGSKRRGKTVAKQTKTKAKFDIALDSLAQLGILINKKTAILLIKYDCSFNIWFKQ